jgi:diacylglycerol O-acyltransferase / wax synthase
MRQLTGVDASFLYMENARTVGHVSGVLIVDPSTAPEPITAETLREFIGQRIHLLEPLRWRLVEVPFGIDLPYWIDDPNLDLSFHIRGIALPAPGTPIQLAEQVARLASRPLDRAHPLWELYVIEGLEDGTVAIMTKLHHAAVDGKSGVQVLATVLDPDPRGREVPPPPDAAQRQKIPTDAEMLGRGWLGLLGRPEAALRLAANVVKEAPGLSRLWTLGAQGRGKLPAMGAAKAPRVSFNKTLSAQRNWAYGSLSLTTVKQVKSRLGCTVNDVVMAVCAGALRQWLTDHDELPDVPLLAAVPISIRAADQGRDMGNQVSGMIAELPTHLADPVERLRAVHKSMAAAKQIHNALPAHLLQDFSQFTAPAAAEFVARTLAGLRIADHVAPPFNVCISNVPGPREPLYYAGALMIANYPVSMIADGMGLNITLQSYRDSLDFGLVGTPELVPDIWRLMAYLEEALHELAAEAGGAVAQSPPPQAPGAKATPVTAGEAGEPAMNPSADGDARSSPHTPRNKA